LEYVTRSALGAAGIAVTEIPKIFEPRQYLIAERRRLEKLFQTQIPLTWVKRLIEEELYGSIAARFHATFKNTSTTFKSQCLKTIDELIELEKDFAILEQDEETNGNRSAENEDDN
jgi:hypothetical protein